MALVERINIIPVLAAEISNDGSQISNMFEKVAFIKGTEGKFYIDFLISALILKKYLIKYILVRKNEDKYEALSFDSFIIPPSDEYIKQHNGSAQKNEPQWSFSNKNIISGHTIIEMKYDTLNKSGEYGILAFGKEIEKDDSDDAIKINEMELLCEKHFEVVILGDD